MKTVLFVIIVFFIASCGVSTIEIADGRIPGRTYEVLFEDQNGNPIKGVTFSCEGAGEFTISTILADSLNESKGYSNELGILKFWHNGAPYSMTFIDGKASDSDKREYRSPICRFLLNGEVVHTDFIESFNVKSTVKLDALEI